MTIFMLQKKLDNTWINVQAFATHESAEATLKRLSAEDNLWYIVNAYKVQGASINDYFADKDN